MRRVLVVRPVLAVWLAGACSSAPASEATVDATPEIDAEVSACAAPALAGPSFGASVVVDENALGAYVPSIAARADGVLVAWHEFEAGVPHVAYARIVHGCVGPTQRIAAEAGIRHLRPAVAATDTGWVIAYQGAVDTIEAIRAVRLDPTGVVIAGPDTISAPGAPGGHVQVSAAGDDVAFAWSDGTAHQFAIQGGHAVAPTPVGTTLLAQGTTNFPRITLAPGGALNLAYRDGGQTAGEWDVFLDDRPANGTFAAPVNLTHSPGAMSDSVALALEPDGTLDVVWIEQVGETFEVRWSRRPLGGAPSAPTAFGGQVAEPWSPAVVPGLGAVWHAGTSEVAGQLFFADGPGAAIPILSGEQGGSSALARAPDGSVHLVFTTGDTPRRLRYARRMAAIGSAP